ncbi:MAG: hypothetical protein ABOK23_11855 [Candidatus Methanoperedens sp.]|nr:hypothetical protein [Candidatus Methanoperedens sp.]MCZ7395240.1 hypothetical protein [Candidatus Methanoperedens sp.]
MELFLDEIFVSLSSRLMPVTKTRALLIAGTGSGVGKTTVALGMIARHHQEGLRSI